MSTDGEHAQAHTEDHTHAHTQAHAPVDGDWRAVLRSSGLRLTPQREMILGAVRDLGHATPDQVHAKVQETSSAVNLSTVYRALEVLEEHGLIRHAHLSDRAPTYHAVSDHEHFHLVCRSCRRVISVDVGMLDGLAEQLHAAHGFVMDPAHVTIFGTCEGNCSA